MLSLGRLPLMSECEICNETFSRESRSPRMLPCGHTLCLPCLVKWAGPSESELKQVTCPECNQKAAIPPAGFPVNYAILRSIEALAIVPVKPAAAASSDVMCANCEEQKAAFFCQSSCGELCGGCSESLHRIRVNRNHVVCGIADMPKPKRMCSEHKDQEALLYCMQCERLACYRCGFGAHRNHGVVDVAEAATEKKALIQQRFEPRIANLRTRLSQIDEEQKLSEHERLSIGAAITSSADRLREAVTARERQLQQSLASLVSAKSQKLALMQDGNSAALATLNQLEQDLRSLQDQDDVSVLDAYGGWLSAVRQGEAADDRGILPGRLLSELDVSVLTEAIAQWGSVHDLPPVQGVVFDQGQARWSMLVRAVEYEVQIARVGAIGERKSDIDIKANAYRRVFLGASAQCEVPFLECGEFALRVRARFEEGWGSFSSAVFIPFEFPPVRTVAFSNGCFSWSDMGGVLMYEVQLAGPIEEKANEAKYEQVYQGNAVSCPYSGFKGPGEYLARVRAQHNAGWGPFSAPFSIQYQGIEWDASKATSDISLSADNKRVARASDTIGTWNSVLSSPLTSSLSRIVSFQVRVDHYVQKSNTIGMAIGVCSRTLSETEVVGYHSGCGYSAYGGDIYNGSPDAKSSHAAYGSGDVIRVEVDFDAKKVSFFKNGVLQGQPFTIDINDHEPLHSAVSFIENGDQVSILD